MGEVPRPHILPAKLLPATLSTTDLTVQSKKSNVVLRYMTRSSGSAELDDKLWERTLLEAERGWLVGLWIGIHLKRVPQCLVGSR